MVIDPQPSRGRSRRRQSAAALQDLLRAAADRDEAATAAALRHLRGYMTLADGLHLADDVRVAAIDAARGAVDLHHDAHPDSQGMPLSALRTHLSALRTHLATAIRGAISIARQEAATVAGRLVDELAGAGGLVRDGDVVRRPQHRTIPPDPGRAQAKERLVRSLDTVAPPPLRAAAQEAGCPEDAIRELEYDGRIIVVGDDLAWSAEAFDLLTTTALERARAAPLTPAALRDATGTSRKYVMALLEELDRRAVLRRTPAGHVPGPRS